MNRSLSYAGSSFFLLAASLLSLSACSSTGDISLFGYSTHSQYAQDIHTVHVPIFKNRTYVRGVEFQLTEAVIKEIESKTPWKVVNDPNSADAELLATIITMPKRVITNNQLREVREGEITLGVEVVWRNCRTGQPVLPPHPDETDPLLGAASGLTPPQPDKKIIVQRSAPFIVELGESTATAKQEVVIDLAKQIVSMLETPW